MSFDLRCFKRFCKEKCLTFCLISQRTINTRKCVHEYTFIYARESSFRSKNSKNKYQKVGTMPWPPF